MLPDQMNITDARRLLPSLIHDLERFPDHVFRITVRRRLVAEIKAPPQISKQGLAAKRLLSLAKKRSRGKMLSSWRVSEDTDRHIYY
ncbi:MAG: hypothetical protein HY922_13925 [Elusimicrobia bacterium]|nr:hypothetical protein [Elusimicrobiota bacterium]